MCGDEDPASDAKEIARVVVDAAGSSGKSVVLLHDRAKDRRVADALPGILNELMRAGREFGKLDETVKPFFFTYTDTES